MPGLDITSETTKFARMAGVDHALLKEMLLAPDTVQHLQRDSTSGIEWPTIALHVKKMSGHDVEAAYSLFVQSTKIDTETYKTGMVWRIYPAELGLTDAAQPLDALKAFLGKYGMKFDNASGSDTLVMFKVDRTLE